MAVSLHSSVGFRSAFRRNSNFVWPDYSALAVGGRVLRLRDRQCLTGGFRVRCGVEEGKSERNGEEAPESLFVKEMKRRGMKTSSLPSGSEEEDSGISKTNLVSTEIENSLSNQRERSMALNSEGIEGLVPRAKLLLATGATFFIGFWPIVVVTVAFFSALYLHFGPSFIHDFSKTHTEPYSYIDPSTLLEDERIS
ncbi:hypothetical protein CK203_012647 [Vitis vinifera]|uniref:Tubulin alpha-6 chain n=1 Tax=Vitis vinifera TaxID=29760 RepID=A0A438KML1_VITVI|nr:hypothetical protein CK203_101531 [Vitis vinifera]RVX22441.1 hypothetical protein CK203_012647 [Vitis vinifera]